MTDNACVLLFVFAKCMDQDIVHICMYILT